MRAPGLRHILHPLLFFLRQRLLISSSKRLFCFLGVIQLRIGITYFKARDIQLELRRSPGYRLSLAKAEAGEIILTNVGLAPISFFQDILDHLATCERVSFWLSLAKLWPASF